jgi:hypothetical protein
MNLHTYAPDKKYMTLQELIENGEWMDHLIDTYGSGLSREKIARQCHMYACTGEDKILTVPYYSLFEDKYVYLPVGFAAHMYSANGCCAGNTRAEAWLHALSEIMERRGNIATLTGGSSAPEVPEHILQQFPTVSKILAQMRSNKNLDIKIFDYSQSPDIPVISTRIIDKDTQRYIVNTGADPILEIAIQRTLTEIFQGKSIHNFYSKNNGRILNNSGLDISHRRPINIIVPLHADTINRNTRLLHLFDHLVDSISLGRVGRVIVVIKQQRMRVGLASKLESLGDKLLATQLVVA